MPQVPNGSRTTRKGTARTNAIKKHAEITIECNSLRLDLHAPCIRLEKMKVTGNYAARQTWVQIPEVSAKTRIPE